MKRDMELIRELLLAIEAVDSPDVFQATLKLKVNSMREDMIHNLKLMVDAGFLLADPLETQAGTSDFLIRRITYAGYEFLDSARNESIWSTARETITKKGLSLESVGFGVLTQVLASAIKQALALN
jgi:Hypothetical protein (DUF2513)